MIEGQGLGPERGAPIRFTGSGSEYFRIWIVNLLLTIVTLGLYWPYARARRLRYFYANTRIGDAALAFHGDPRLMMRGFLLVALAWVSYIALERFDARLAAGLIVLYLAAWPALWRAGLRFRLANTSWRGVRLRFEGSLRGAYMAFLPLLLTQLAAFALIWWLLPAESGEPASADPMLALGLGAAALLVVSLAPWTMARMMVYRQGQSAWASEQGRLLARTGAFYGGAVQLAALAALSVAVCALVAFAVISLAIRLKAEPGAFALVPAITMVLTYVALLGIVWPFASAHLQNLVWGRTCSERLRLHSQLSARKLAGLLLVNIVLTVVTLGLYRPFAAVAMARLRLEAVAVEFSEDPSTWLGPQAGRRDDATGDFAGEVFGYDLGV